MPMTTVPPKLLADQVFEALKREIIECRLPPGSLIVETTLAARYGTSKGPVREALKRLAQMRLVSSIPRTGYMVSSVNLGDLEEIFTMRIALESLAARLATPRLTDDELDELERIASTPLLDEPPERRGLVLIRSNSEFHNLIARRSGNRRLATAVEVLVDELERMMHILSHDQALADVVDQHMRLVDTLRRRDPARAAELMADQLELDRQLMRRLATETDQGHAMTLQVPVASQP